MDDYIRALNDITELLDNAKANKGGIWWGTGWIKGAHWDYEIRDQIEMLKDNRIKEIKNA